MIHGDDGSFSSLALYIFNKADQHCEYSELIPEFTPQRLEEFSRSVNVSPQTKVIYAIANYNDPDKTFSVPVSPDLTLQQMERLVARLDIYMFKNQGLESSSVVVNSIEFVNQILNTNSSPEVTSMPTPISKKNVSEVFLGGTTLQLMPSDLSEIVPENAHASFYTYRNIVPDATPDANTPYIRIKALFNGISYTYRGYLTDQGQTTHKYSLLHNTVYRVMAMLDHPDNQLIIKTTPYPWELTSSEIGQEITEDDYQLQPYNGDDAGATTGIVQFPYIANGEAHNETSYANYSFSLTAPAGAIWTATLTNGLDFTFGMNGGLNVSKGIARDEAYTIQVGATKRWSGNPKSTYFYITAGGVKLRINPKQSNGNRQFPGDNDTDILIRQTEYK